MIRLGASHFSQHSTTQHSTAPTCCCSSPVSAETNGRSYSSIHSHMQKAPTVKANDTATATQHPKISLFLTLSHSRPLQVYVLVFVCFLFSLTLILHTHSLRAAIALYLLVLMALLLSLYWCACFVVGWQNNKNEECLQTNRSVFG